MRALVQRVRSGRVTVDGGCIGEIGHGMVILLGVRDGDTREEAKLIAEKCANLRIFADADGRFDRSLADVAGAALVVSQFTLYGDCRKGRRPNFTRAARPEIAEPIYEYFVEVLQGLGFRVETGRFGAMMEVEIRNDGPVTVMVESKDG